MKALIVPAVGQLEVREIAAPQIGPYQALVRMEVCGICNSTDQKLIDGTMFWAPPFPFVLGHESVGTVIEVGNRVRNFRAGDRVTRPIYVPPPGETINSANGGFAAFGVVSDARAMAADGDASLLNDYNAQRQLVVPPDIGTRDAALCISLSETASVLRHLPNPRGRNIVVAGTGVAGLAFALWFKLAGARVIVLGRREARLKKALEIGADVALDTRDPDLLAQLRQFGPVEGLMEATGDAALAGQLLEVLEPEGFACAYGVPPTGTGYDPRWRSAVVEEHLSLPWVLDLLRRGWIQPEWFVSHEWDFNDVLTAFEQNRRGEVTKGFVHFGSS